MICRDAFVCPGAWRLSSRFLGRGSLSSGNIKNFALTARILLVNEKFPMHSALTPPTPVPMATPVPMESRPGPLFHEIRSEIRRVSSDLAVPPFLSIPNAPAREPRVHTPFQQTRRVSSDLAVAPHSPAARTRQRGIRGYTHPTNNRGYGIRRHPSRLIPSRLIFALACKLKIEEEPKTLTCRRVRASPLLHGRNPLNGGATFPHGRRVPSGSLIGDFEPRRPGQASLLRHVFVQPGCTPARFPTIPLSIRGRYSVSSREPILLAFRDLPHDGDKTANRYTICFFCFPSLVELAYWPTVARGSVTRGGSRWEPP
jgi:hypothetical protein